MKDPLIFFCPSQKHKQHSYNHATSNPWPPGAIVGNQRAAVSARPLIRQNNADAPLAYLKDIDGLAVTADISSSPTRIESAHVDGTNVIYFDGHAKWMDIAIFQNELDSVGSGNFSSSKNGAMQELWDVYDENE